ncbi:caspase family protein [Kribbella amoyensis]|uniref:caspase family protein n=1 Tax=Kribbella amoyensis TaxID=996641 RepID=UPI001478E564|nr:caspase family protein [Kribbella amoyensis]
MDGSRVALVVANDRYADPGLRRLVAPAQDAAALAEVLADPAVGGFEVRVLRNEPAQEIRFAVEDFFADRAPEDLLVLHFSCHGLKNAAGELFLAVADTKPTRLASTAVAADFVNRQMADSRAQRIALFLDCCYGGAFPRGMVVRAAGEAQVRDAFAGQDEVGGGRGRVVVTASSAMEYAFEGEQLASDSAGSPSVFTSAVVAGLASGEADRDGDGWIGLTELVGYVGDRVHLVTPNQHPQMWTFGSSGELLIARSRVRRITPAPPAPELLEAMESPLSATRFGVVDFLRERVGEADLAQAFGAWEALHRMTEDDSRKVSETARTALAEAVPRVEAESVTLTTSMPEATSTTVRLAGPPLARTAVASTEAGWLDVDQDGAEIRLTATPPAEGIHEAVLELQGPTGESTVLVHLLVGADVELPATGSMPEPQPLPEPAPEPEPHPTPEPEPPAVATASVREPAVVPWWVVGVLAIGAFALVAMNWPGALESRKIWTDEDQTGWRVFRSWDDALVLGSFVALAGALVARFADRWAPVALGVVAGCAVSFVETGVLILLARLSGEEFGVWVAVTVVAAGMATLIAVRYRPIRWAFWPVGAAAAGLVVAGGIVQLVGAGLRHDDGIAFLTVSPLVALDPVVGVALAWLAVAATDRRSRTWLSAAAATYAILAAYSALAALHDGAPAVFLASLGGTVLIVVGLALSARRPLAAGEPITRPTAATLWLRQNPTVIVVAGLLFAVLLVFFNLAAVDRGLRLWYNTSYGSPDVSRHLTDGILTTAVLMLIGAVLAGFRGRLGRYGMGAAAGSAALFATGGVVVLGGRIWYDDNLYVWSASLVIAAVLLAVVLFGTAATEYRRPATASTVVLGAGLALLLVFQLIPDQSGPSAATYTHGLSLLLPVTATGLVLLASLTANPVAVGAAVSYLVLFCAAGVYPISINNAPVYFGAMIAGHLVLLLALYLGLRLPTPASPSGVNLAVPHSDHGGVG